MPSPSERPTSWIVELTSGLIIGLMTVVLATSFAALIFSGPLSGHVSLGIGLALLTSVIVLAVGAMSSSLPSVVAIPQDRTAPILALMTASISVGLVEAGASQEVLVWTCVGSLLVAGMTTGLVLLVMGMLRWGTLIRFIPYPVMGGFLAGTGWLLLTGAVGVVTGEGWGTVSWRAYLEPDLLVRWLPALIYGLTLLVAMRAIGHFLTMPVMIFLGFVVFYGALAGFRIPIGEARDLGWILATEQEQGLLHVPTLQVFQQADWAAVFAEFGKLGSVIFVSAISLLLNSSALELAAGRDLEIDRELKSAGAMNLLTASCCGLVGFHSLSLSSLALKMRARTRWVGGTAAVVALLLLLLGPSLVAFLPKPLLGGLLMFLGLTFLAEWIYDGARRLPLGDYGMVLIILAVIGMFGYIEGVIVGVLLAVVHFVLRYSKMNNIKAVMSGSDCRSSLDRTLAQSRVLGQQGEDILVIRLQGFLFFGTANRLYDQVRDQVRIGGRRPRFLVLEFRSVQGLDVSAVMSLNRMREFLRPLACQLIFADIGRRQEKILRLGGLIGDSEESCRVFADLDHGLEWCEERVLAATAPDLLEGQSGDLDDQFVQLGQPELMGLMPYLERLTLRAGEALVHEGEPADALYFVESGRVAVHLLVGRARQLRVRSMGPGALVGEIGLFLQATRGATVMAEVSTVCYRLSAGSLRRLEAEQSAVAVALNRYLVMLLAERLNHTNRALQRLS